MPAEQFRGMTKRTQVIKIRGRLKEPKSKFDWSATRKFNGQRYHLKTIKVKKPLKSDIKKLRKKENVRVVSSKPRLGYRVNIHTGAVVGKHAIYTKPKPVRFKKKKHNRKRKGNKRTGK